MSDDLIGTIWVGVALAALLAFVFGVVISTLKDLRRTVNKRGERAGEQPFGLSVISDTGFDGQGITAGLPERRATLRRLVRGPRHRSAHRRAGLPRRRLHQGSAGSVLPAHRQAAPGRAAHAL